MEPFAVKVFNVHSYETDPAGFARPVALLNYIQEAGVEHAAMLNVSVSDLRKSGHTWVISRLHLAMERYPRMHTTVRLRTWPVMREAIFSVRDFELLDGDGGMLGRATGSFAVLNLKTRRPARLDDVLPPYPLMEYRALQDDFKGMPLLKTQESESRFQVLRSDLDVNCHVNNTVYATWALEAVPAEIAGACLPMEIEINFRAEALHGDEVVSRCGRAPDEDGICFLHTIGNGRDGREFARLRTRWEPIPPAF